MALPRQCRRGRLHLPLSTSGFRSTPLGDRKRPRLRKPAGLWGRIPSQPLDRIAVHVLQLIIASWRYSLFGANRKLELFDSWSSCWRDNLHVNTRLWAGMDFNVPHTWHPLLSHNFQRSSHPITPISALPTHMASTLSHSVQRFPHTRHPPISQSPGWGITLPQNRWETLKSMRLSAPSEAAASHLRRMNSNFRIAPTCDLLHPR